MGGGGSGRTGSGRTRGVPLGGKDEELKKEGLRPRGNETRGLAGYVGTEKMDDGWGTSEFCLKGWGKNDPPSP